MRILSIAPLALAITAVSGSTAVAAQSVSHDPSRSFGLADSPAGVHAAGANYEALFDERGVTINPALGPSAPATQELRIEARSVGRGDNAPLHLEAATPEIGGSSASYDRGGGVTESYLVNAEGLEQTFLLQQPLPGTGDLVVKCRLSGNLAVHAEPDALGGASFEGPFGGLRLGGVTGIDADGVRVSGSLRASQDELELTLPEAFVNAARWPILVDPTIGAVFPINVDTWDDGQPDIAYDKAAERYLVVWQRSLSASNAAVRGQLLDASGNPEGGVIFFDNGTGSAGAPKVANIVNSKRFLVAWSVDSLTSQVRVQACDAATGVLSTALPIWTSTPACLRDVDIGGSAHDNTDQRNALVVFRNSCVNDSIICRTVNVPPTGTPVLGSAVSLATAATVFDSLDAPTITRTGGASKVWLVAWRKYSALLSGDWDIQAVALDSNGSPISSVVAVSTGSDDEGAPEVDGGATLAPQFAVVYARDKQSGLNELEITTLVYANGVLTKKGTSTVDSNLPAFTDYAVAWTPGLATVAWAKKSILSNTRFLKAQDFEMKTAKTCGAEVDLATITPAQGSGGVALAIASVTTGASPGLGEGLIAFSYQSPTASQAGNIYGQRFDALPSGGPIVNVGGSCGLGGTIIPYGDAAIGNEYFQLTLINADPSSTFTFLNLSTSLAAFDCGACEWLPFQVPILFGTLNGASQAVISIPCAPGLVGVTLGAQFTTFTPASSPCNISPNVSVSDIVQFGIGG